MRRWWSGQSQQTVNLSPSGFGGSNPSLRTRKIPERGFLRGAERRANARRVEGFEKVEHVARSKASTTRRLYRSCKDQIPFYKQRINLCYNFLMKNSQKGSATIRVVVIVFLLIIGGVIYYFSNLPSKGINQLAQNQAPIVVISPKDSEALNIGSSYIIRWSGPSNASYNLILVKSDKDQREIAQGTIASNIRGNQYSWIVGFAGIDPGTGGGYKIKVENSTIGVQSSDKSSGIFAIMIQ
jgi:hypothetical protein